MSKLMYTKFHDQSETEEGRGRRYLPAVISAFISRLLSIELPDGFSDLAAGGASRRSD